MYHELTLAQILINELSSVKNITVYSPKTAESGVVTFNIDDKEASAVSNILDQKYNIATRSGLHCAPLAHKYIDSFKKGGAVRLSVGYFNTQREIYDTIRAIKTIAKN